MKFLFSLVAISLLASLAQDPATSRRDEARLLNQTVESSHLSQTLRVWDAPARSWRESKPSDLQKTQARILVVNLWAHYCKPCIAEFPILRDMAKRIEDDTKGDVKFLFISETSSPNDMQQFVTDHGKRLPDPPWFLDYNENIVDGLRHALPGRSLSLPTTIILDERRVVRYALMGALLSRRSELVAAIMDTYRATKPGNTN